MMNDKIAVKTNNVKQVTYRNYGYENGKCYQRSAIFRYLEIRTKLKEN